MGVCAEQPRGRGWWVGVECVDGVWHDVGQNNRIIGESSPFSRGKTVAAELECCWSKGLRPEKNVQ